MKVKQNAALLIDADNISSKYIKTIIDELTSNFENVSIKRVYGDWTSDNLKPWKKIMLEFSLTPIQQFSYSSGKNSTDSAMIIDAMDILYTKEVDAFCLATSDSDFTKIASRLRESGKTVVGMGESEKKNKSFVAACNEFKYLDILYNEYSENVDDNLSQSINEITPLNDVKEYIFNLLNSKTNIDLGSLKRFLKQKFSDFDERNYEYSKFSTFILEISELKIDKKNNTVSINFINNINEIRRYIVLQMTNSKKKCYTSEEIHNLIAKEFKDFKLNSMGYSTMKSFLKSINDLSIDKDGKYRLLNNN